MYVDESGSVSYNDSTNYFVLSGIIVAKDKIKELKRASYEYKLKNFVDNYIDSEIHTHSIYQSRHDFANLDLAIKQELLDELYTMINALDVTIISVAINKELLKSQYPKWKVFNIAWDYLVKRFDKFLEDNCKVHGSIKVDKSSKRLHRSILNIISDLKKNDTNFQRKTCIDNAVFVDSAAAEGIQIADAVAYCSSMHVNDRKEYNRYWDLIYPKFWQSPQGIIDDYGWKEFPK